jgi:hypothetical protein
LWPTTPAPEKGEDRRTYAWVNVMPDADPNGVHPQGEVDPYRELIEELFRD